MGHPEIIVLASDLSRRVGFIGRVRKLFVVISWLAGSGLVIMAAISIVMLASDPAHITPDVGNGLRPQTGLARAHILALVATLIVLALLVLTWLVWIFCSVRLVKKAGAERMHHGPLASIALHFVPVIGQVMPMLIITELEKVTRDPVRWKELPDNALPSSSWVVAKLSAIGYLVALDYLQTAERAAQYATGLWIMLGASVGLIGGLFLVGKFLRHMNALQTELASAKEASLPSALTETS